MRSRLAFAALVAVVLVGAACTGDDDAEPSPTTSATSSTSVIDRSGIALAGVPGATTSTITERGTTQLTGSVQGPSGLVVGATVRIERLVAGREIRTDLLTGPDGRFVLADVPGGRYRVRAFLAPSLVQAVPEVRFLQDGGDYD
ncbi:MAG: carboxypeptidase-like regulatory domain-containing protein, partial [Acidimicrobiales bacterium]